MSVIHSGGSDVLKRRENAETINAEDISDNLRIGCDCEYNVDESAMIDM